MTEYVVSSNILVKYKSQTAKGTLAASGAGALQFRPNVGSPGLTLGMASIASNENRGDGMTSRARLGTRNVTGSYNGDLALGAFDTPLEAIARGTWSTGAALTIANTDTLGALSVSSGVLTFATGGLTALNRSKVGDVFKSTVGLNAADLNKNLRITAQTNTTITAQRLDGVALTDVAGPVATYSFTLWKKVLDGVTRRAFTVEEHFLDIDSSEIYEWVRWSAYNLGVVPDQMAILGLNVVGRDQSTVTGGSAPYFTGETKTNSLGLSARDLSLWVKGTKVLDLTELRLQKDLRAANRPVAGTNISPDVFDNSGKVTVTLEGLRSDFTRVADYIAETPFEVHGVLTENEAEPADGIAFCTTNVIFDSFAKSAIGQDGPQTARFTLSVGADDRGGAYDPTMVKFMTSAP